MEIRRCTVADIMDAPNLDEVVAAYASHAIAGMPCHGVEWHRYQELEDVGALSAIGAFDQHELAGMACLLTYPSLHYGVPITVTESLFALERYRSAGIALIRESERLTAEMKSAALMVTSRAGSRLERLLPQRGYAPAHTVHCKVLHGR